MGKSSDFVESTVLYRVVAFSLWPPSPRLQASATSVDTAEMSLASELASAQKLYKSGSLDSALECCKRAIKLEGGKEHAGVHICFGAIFTAQDEPEMAERAFDSALEIDPESVQALKGKAALLERFGDGRLDELLPVAQALAKLNLGSKGSSKGGDQCSAKGGGGGKSGGGAKGGGGAGAKAPTDWAAKLAIIERKLGISTVDYADNYGAEAVDVGDDADGKKGGGSGGGRGAKEGGGAGTPRAGGGAKSARAAAAAAAAAAVGGGGGKRGSKPRGSNRESDEEGDDEGGDAGGGAKTERSKSSADGDGASDPQEAGKAELAELRAMVKAGAKLSGKQKRNLKKLEEAEQRWKEYEAAAGGGGSTYDTADGGEPGEGGAPLTTEELHAQLAGRSAAAALPGSQFRVEVGGDGGVSEQCVRPRRRHRRARLHDPRRQRRAARECQAQPARRAAIRPDRAQRQGQDDAAQAHRDQGAARAAAGARGALRRAGGARVRRVGHRDAARRRHAPRGAARRGAAARGGARRGGAAEEAAGADEAAAEAAAREALAASEQLVAVYEALEAHGSEASEGRARTLLSGLGFDAAKQEAPTTALGRLAHASRAGARALPAARATAARRADQPPRPRRVHLAAGPPRAAPSAS